MPPLTADAQRWAAEDYKQPIYGGGGANGRTADWTTDRSLCCITRGLPARCQGASDLTQEMQNRKPRNGCPARSELWECLECRAVQTLGKARIDVGQHGEQRGFGVTPEAPLECAGGLLAVLARGRPAAWKGMLNAVFTGDQRAKKETVSSCQFGYQLAIKTAQRLGNFPPVHSVRDRGVGGSNPLAPTSFPEESLGNSRVLSGAFGPFWVWSRTELAQMPVLTGRAVIL